VTMSGKIVRKAVIPAAGFGTRFLPFTKSVPKELIPLVDRPVLQYVVEEAAASGIEDILLVLSTEKEAVIRHFNPFPELENRLRERNKTTELAVLKKLDGMARIHYVYQQELNGLGDAIRYAESFAGNDPFAVLLGDTVMDSSNGVPVIGQLIDVFRRYGASVVALEEVPKERIHRYGVAGGTMLDGAVLKIRELVEKPAPEKAPSNLAVAARYVFEPEIFAALARTPRGKDNELQITDAMKFLLTERDFYGCRIAGRRYDIGNPMGFLQGTVEFGLKRPEFREEFKAFLVRTLQQMKD